MGGEETTKSSLWGASGFQAEHLKGWIAAAKRKEREEVAAEKEHLMEERTREGTNGTVGG